MTHGSTPLPTASTDSFTARADAPEALAFDSLPDAPPEGERWSTWDGAAHGPTPRPAWVITELAAVDAESTLR